MAILGLFSPTEPNISTTSLEEMALEINWFNSVSSCVVVFFLLSSLRIFIMLALTALWKPTSTFSLSAISVVAHSEKARASSVTSLM